jgi:hypothetical protein
MKYLLVFFFCFFCPKILFAGSFSSRIHSIAFGKSGSDHLVRFENARVGFLDSRDRKLLASFVMSTKSLNNLKIDVDQRNKIVAAQSLKTNLSKNHESSKLWKNISYVPDIMRSYNKSLGIFKLMRRDFDRNGECFNRAHIWSYEENQRSGLNSMKIFMFFTERYIRKYKFHWWFHVTPMVYVQNKQSPYTLDRRYNSGPRTTKTWSDTFIKSKLRCPKVKRYDDFWLNQKKNDCYHLHASMYYLIPRDLEKRDLTGLEKSGFDENEISKAYKNGFNVTYFPSEESGGSDESNNIDSDLP